MKINVRICDSFVTLEVPEPVYLYLKKAKRKEENLIHNELVLTGKLYDHLREVDTAAETRLSTIIPQLMQNAGITETLKAQNQMDWVRRMNAIKAQAEEIIHLHGG